MGYNLALLPNEVREQIQLEKSAAYLAWQEQHDQVTAAAVQQQIMQQPETSRAYFIEQLKHYRQRFVAPASSAESCYNGSSIR